MKASARFTIAIGRAPGRVVVTVHGELDRSSAAHLASILADLINSQEKPDLVVDLRDAQECDADAPAVLASAAALAQRRGGTLVLSGASGTISPGLEAAGLVKLLISDGGRWDRSPESGSHHGGRGAHPSNGGLNWGHGSGPPEESRG